MDAVKMITDYPNRTRLRETLDILGRLLYRSRCQHRRQPIYTRMHFVLKKAERILAAKTSWAEPHGARLKQDLRTAILAAATALSAQIAHTFFLPGQGFNREKEEVYLPAKVADFLGHSRPTV
eukprot:g2970.t1